MKPNKSLQATLFLLIGICSGLFAGEKPEKDADFPPVPEWEPDIKLPQDKIIERFSYYTGGERDYVVFAHGTCVIVTNGLSDDDARKEATATLARILNYHPDMKPFKMNDGNILVRYNHPAYNVVLDEITKKHMKTIEANHQRALARDEVLITPFGDNKFDEFGMKALFGRCYFFMDAKQPVVTKIVRNTESGQGVPSIAYVLLAISMVGYFAIQVFATARLRAAAKKINGVISSRSDLNQVRNAIQTNLFLGIPTICNGVLLLGSLFWAGSNSRGLMLLCIAVMAAGQVVMWRIFKPVERRFKALPVEGGDADLTMEYQHYVKQWSGFHLFLKPPKGRLN